MILLIRVVPMMIQREVYEMERRFSLVGPHLGPTYLFGILDMFGISFRYLGVRLCELDIQ